jgi:peptidoglycan hydrolase-like protein with peptidoglycan-binding domain
MKKIIITEQQLQRIMTSQLKQTNKRDPKIPDTYPDIRKIKGVQGLLNKLYNAKLVVDGKKGPKTSEVLKKYIIERGMRAIMCTPQWCGQGIGPNIVDETFGGNRQLATQLLDIMIKDGLKNFVPPVPIGSEKYKFDK